MTKKAGIYARLSLITEEGQGFNVDDQVRRCRGLAAERGFEVIGDPYEDRSISASGRKYRPAYERLLADARAGRIDVILANTADRLTRDLEEFGHLANLVIEHDIDVVLVTGEFDVSTSDSEFKTGIEGLLSRRERRKVGERVKEKHEARRLRGVPPGSRWRTFGYTGANVKQGIIGWQVVPDEAEVVCEVFERVAAGESLNSITNDLRARGVKRVSGEPWAYQATLRMVSSPIYAGIITYQGHRTDQKVTAEGFEPLVSETLYDAAQSRQRRPEPGRRDGRNARKALLSGIAICDTCKSPMTVSGKGSVYYVCDRRAGGCGNIRIRRRWLDDIVNEWMRTAAVFDPPSEVDETQVAGAEAYEAQESAIKGRIDRTRKAMAAGDLDYDDGLAMLSDLRAELARIMTARTAEAVQAESLWKPLEDYDAADLTRQAAEVRRRITALVVKPAVVRGYTKFDPRRFEVRMSGGKTIDGPEFVRRTLRLDPNWRRTAVAEPGAAEWIEEWLSQAASVYSVGENEYGAA